MKKLAYVDADKYIVAKDYTDIAPFKPGVDIVTSYGEFKTTGEFTIKKGFLFSANFPAINTEDSRRGACVHDFFYCLMKDGHLPRSYRSAVDKYFYTILIEDNMIPMRASYWLKGVQIGGDAALDAPYHKVKYAPPDPMPEAGHQVKDLLSKK